MESGTWMAQAQAGSGARLLAWLMAGFIVYGSLYPFAYRPLPDGMTFTQALWLTWHMPMGGRGDLLANALLYMPLGLTLVAALARRAVWLALPLALLGCVVLTTMVEVGQIFVPGRVPSGWDLTLNAAGGAAGAIAGVVLGIGRGGRGLAWGLVRPRLADGGAALLLAGWLGYRLYPFVPAIDRGEWVQSLAPLLSATSIDIGRVLRLGGLWLMAARLLEAAVPWGRGRWVQALVLLGTPAAAVPIVDRALTPEELLAAVLALPAWWLLRRWRRSDAVLLAVMLAAVVAEGMAPYRLAAAKPFGWLPFGAVLHGQYAAGLQAVMLKLFLYGGLVWLAVRVGVRWTMATLGVVALALAIGMVQTHLPGRSAEVTDAVLAFGTALALRSGLRARDGRV